MMEVSDMTLRRHGVDRYRGTLERVLQHELSPVQFKKAQSEIRRFRATVPEAQEHHRTLFEFYAYDSFVMGFVTQLCGNAEVVFSPDYTPDSLRGMALSTHEELSALYLDREVDCPAFRAYVNALELSRLMVLEFALVWPERIR